VGNSKVYMINFGLCQGMQNKVALQQTAMRMVRWMCVVNLQDRVPSKGLRERLGWQVTLCDPI